MSLPKTSWTRFLFAVRALKVGNPTAKLVLYALASRADRNGYCYPSVNCIAQDTDLHRRTVQRRLEQLEAEGFIVRSYRRRVDSPGRHDTIVYRLLVASHHYPVTQNDGRSGTGSALVGAERPPNLPVTNQKNGGNPQTVGEDGPPADASDVEHRRRIAEMASELADRLRGGRR